jgi:hypothetical protein
MNQKQLEIAVRGIQNDLGLDSHRKAYLMQNIMASRYIVAQQNRVNELQSHPCQPVEDLPAASFHDAAARIMGCSHYKRKWATLLIHLSLVVPLFSFLSCYSFCCEFFGGLFHLQ